jgi:hypothetical protein
MHEGSEFTVNVQQATKLPKIVDIGPRAARSFGISGCLALLQRDSDGLTWKNSSLNTGTIFAPGTDFWGAADNEKRTARDAHGEVEQQPIGKEGRDQQGPRQTCRERAGQRSEEKQTP